MERTHPLYGPMHDTWSKVMEVLYSGSNFLDLDEVTLAILRIMFEHKTHSFGTVVIRVVREVYHKIAMFHTWRD